jgi:hypothetical protein
MSFLTKDLASSMFLLITSYYTISNIHQSATVTIAKAEKHGQALCNDKFISITFLIFENTELLLIIMCEICS